MSDFVKLEDLTDDMTVQAIRSYTYSLKNIYIRLSEDGLEDITIDDLISMAHEFASEDLSCGHGHYLDFDDIEYTYNLGSGNCRIYL